MLAVALQLNDTCINFWAISILLSVIKRFGILNHAVTFTIFSRLYVAVLSNTKLALCLLFKRTEISSGFPKGKFIGPAVIE